MRRLALAAMTLLFIVCAYAQQSANFITVSSLNVRNQLPGNLDKWLTTPGAIIMVAQKKPGAPLKEIKLVAQLKGGGAIICGSNVSSAKTMEAFDVRNFQASEIVSALGQCKELKEGNYTLCVQFFNIDNRPVSMEVCREFNVKEEKAADEYAPATLINPENGKQFTEKQLQQPVTFRWTPIVPKPKEPVTYRLRVWQLMQGQNGMQAMKTNTPLISKDVDNLTQATVTGVITGPCKPPYMCDFIWSIQSLSRNGKPFGNNNGNSEAFTFTANASQEIKTLVNVFPGDKKSISIEEGKKSITFKWKVTDSKQPDGITYRLRVWQLMQGQNAQQAMKLNKPIVTKEVQSSTEALVTGVITGPCKPPYMCDFIWNVQVINRDGQPAGGNEGSSEPTTFKMTSGGCIGDIKIDSVKCTGTKNGKNIYRLCVTYKADINNTCTILFNDPQNASLNLSLPSNNINNIIYSFTAGTSISNMSPAIGSLPASLAAGGSVSACFDLTANPGTPTATIGAFGLCNDGLQNTLHNTGNDLDSIVLPPCECNPCNDMPVTIEKDSIKIPKSGNPAQLNVTGFFTGLNNNLIKKVTAEIIYFDIQQTKDKECAKCVFDSKQFGNFTLPASPLTGYTGPVLNKPDYSRLITWTSTVIKDCGGQPHGDGTSPVDPTGKTPNLSIDKQTPKRDFGDKSAIGIGIPDNPNPLPGGPPKFILPISVPDASALSCCGDVIKICIRYTFYDFCCHTCEVIKCYEIKREK